MAVNSCVITPMVPTTVNVVLDFPSNLTSTHAYVSHPFITLHISDVEGTVTVTIQSVYPRLTPPEL